MVVPNKRLVALLDGKSVPALRVAPEKARLSVTRRLFGITKLRVSRPDGRFIRYNSDNSDMSTDPRPHYHLDPASARARARARTHSAQALDPYSEIKRCGHSLYDSISCAQQALSLVGSR